MAHIHTNIATENCSRWQPDDCLLNADFYLFCQLSLNSRERLFIYTHLDFVERNKCINLVLNCSLLTNVSFWTMVTQLLSSVTSVLPFLIGLCCQFCWSPVFGIIQLKTMCFYILYIRKLFVLHDKHTEKVIRCLFKLVISKWCSLRNSIAELPEDWIPPWGEHLKRH